MLVCNIIGTEFIVLARCHVKGIECGNAFQTFYRGNVFVKIHMDCHSFTDSDPGRLADIFPGVNGILGCFQIQGLNEFAEETVSVRRQVQPVADGIAKVKGIQIFRKFFF